MISDINHMCMISLEYGFSCELLENDFLHNWQMYGLSPLWVLICAFRLLFPVNDLWHNRHVDGFPPVWVLMCAFRLSIPQPPVKIHDSSIVVVLL